MWFLRWDRVPLFELGDREVDEGSTTGELLHFLFIYRFNKASPYILSCINSLFYACLTFYSILVSELWINSRLNLEEVFDCLSNDLGKSSIIFYDKSYENVFVKWEVLTLIILEFDTVNMEWDFEDYKLS